MLSCLSFLLAAIGDSRRLARAGGVKGAAGAASARAEPVLGRTTLEAARPREHNEKARAANPIAAARISYTRARSRRRGHEERPHSQGVPMAVADRGSGSGSEGDGEGEG